MKNKGIERKFIVNDNLNLSKLNIIEKKLVEQLYLYIDNYCDIRIRNVYANNNYKYYYTVKISKSNFTSRDEIEFEITKQEYLHYSKFQLPSTNIISKNRYVILLPKGLKAELDIYNNNLKGLKTVEVEFDNLVDENRFDIPKWFKEEVTENINYKNKNLTYKKDIFDEINRMNL